MIHDVDARGLLCPLPVLRLRKQLLALEPGTQVRLTATDPAAVIDVPHFCAEGRHLLIDTQTLADGAFVFIVQKAADDSAAKGTS